MNLKRICASVLLSILLLTCLSGCGKTTNKLRFGTGGIYYTYGNALAPSLKKATGLNVEIRTTTDSEANLRLKWNKKTDPVILVVEGDVFENAMEKPDYLSCHTSCSRQPVCASDTK